MLAALTGAMVPRLSPGAAAGQSAVGGAIAGGASSIVGGLLAVVSGQWPDFQALQLLYPAISGGVAGGVGALRRPSRADTSPRALRQLLRHALDAPASGPPVRNPRSMDNGGMHRDGRGPGAAGWERRR